MGGYPLLAWSIAAAKLSSRVTRVVVSTDSPDYAALARHYGAETPFLRPAELAQDHSLDIEFLLHALDWFKKNENYFPDFLMHLRPTSPLRDPQVLDQAVDMITGKPEATSVISVCPADHPPHKYLKMNQAGFLTSYIDGVEIHIPRQQCPQAYRCNGYVDVLRSASVWESKSHLGSNIWPIFTENPSDIDIELDFVKTGKELNGKVGSLLEYLEKIGPFASYDSLNIWKAASNGL